MNDVGFYPCNVMLARILAMALCLYLYYQSSEFGRHAFSYCAPSVWNKLPLSIRSLNRFISFKSHLKSHPFLHKCPLISCHLATACASDSSLVCMYVCVSFHCELVFCLYLAGRIELIFGMGASFDLSYTVL